MLIKDFVGAKIATTPTKECDEPMKNMKEVKQLANLIWQLMQN